MKKLFLFLLVVCFMFSAVAQEKGYIYLKDGTILKGKFQYSSDFNKLIIESAGNIRVFNTAEIDSVSSIPSRRKPDVEEVFSVQQLFFRTGIGLLAGNSENSQPAPLSFIGSVNYPLQSKTLVGAGTGIEFFKESYLPLYLNVEYWLRVASSTPYFFVQTGYQIPLEDSRAVYYDVYPMWSSIWPGPDYPNQNLDARGGVLFNPGVGYMRMLREDLGISVAFGYRYHRLRYTGEKDYELHIDYNRLSIRVGIIFN